MKFKHNKKRNSAFVYEALIREATVATMKMIRSEKKQQCVLSKSTLRVIRSLEKI